MKSGVIRGTLVDAGLYPALILPKSPFASESLGNPEDSADIRLVRLIEGEWLEVTEEGLKAMDELEEYRGPGQENDYERVWVRDEMGELEGWVYVWLSARGLPEIVQGSWRLYRQIQN